MFLEYIKSYTLMSLTVNFDFSLELNTGVFDSIFLNKTVFSTFQVLLKLY